MTYTPRKDSFFLKNWLEKQELEGKKVLDMGTGSGILAITAAEKGARVTAVDIDPEALKEAEQNAREKKLVESIDFKESDLFEDVEESFDLIVFNPPYLPGRKIDEEDKKWRGGGKGVEVTENFLNQVPEHLEDGGEAVFIGSSRAELDELIESFELEVLGSEKIWFETLYLLKRG